MTILKDKLDKINLTELGIHIQDDVYRQYVLSPPGKEHYSLLAYFSTLFNNSILLDIGTYKGCSAVALSYNPTNTVYSYDITNAVELKSLPKNILFDIPCGDLLIDPDIDDVLEATPFICLDTAHTGDFETNFFKKLLKVKYKGMLFLGDINLNNEMKLFWSNILVGDVMDGISIEKYDLTQYGHWSGSGLVIFK